MSRTRVISALVALTLLVFALGCNKQETATPRTDSQVAADITNKINSDANLPNKQISVGSNNGVVTLSGTVGSEGERLAAANDASQVEGVKTVVNNLVVSSAANGMAESMPPASTTHRATTTRGSGNKVHTSLMPSNSSTTPETNSNVAMAPPPANVPPAPAPIVDITVPQGTIFSVRTIEPLDSERSQV